MVVLSELGGVNHWGYLIGVMMDEHLAACCMHLIHSEHNTIDGNMRIRGTQHRQYAGADNRVTILCVLSTMCSSYHTDLGLRLGDGGNDRNTYKLGKGKFC